MWHLCQFTLLSEVTTYERKKTEFAEHIFTQRIFPKKTLCKKLFTQFLFFFSLYAQAYPHKMARKSLWKQQKQYQTLDMLCYSLFRKNNEQQEAMFLFVGLHCPFIKFNVRQSEKIQIKIKHGSKLHYFHHSELFMSVVCYVFYKFLTQNMNHAYYLLTNFIHSH